MRVSIIYVCSLFSQALDHNDDDDDHDDDLICWVLIDSIVFLWKFLHITFD